jgi:hypothetical protein
MEITLASVSLPSSLQWIDQYSNTPVTQTLKHTLSGNAVYYSSPNINGTPITLAGGTDYGWMKKSVLDQVLAMSKEVGTAFTLTMGSDTFSVVFDHTQGNALTAKPLYPYATPSDDDYYIVTMKFFTS